MSGRKETGNFSIKEVIAGLPLDFNLIPTPEINKSGIVIDPFSETELFILIAHFNKQKPEDTIAACKIASGTYTKLLIKARKKLKNLPSEKDELTNAMPGSTALDDKVIIPLLIKNAYLFDLSPKKETQAV